jgi:hypothetical protein
VLESAKRNFALFFASNGVVAFAVSLGLIGFAGARDPWISRAGLIVGGYMASFLIAGRIIPIGGFSIHRCSPSASHSPRWLFGT